MEWLEILLKVLIGWSAISVVFVLAWSRFMGHLHRMDRQVARHTIHMNANQLRVYKRAA